MVTERLLHEESKSRGQSNQAGLEGALMTGAKKKLRCHFCRRLGHFKRDCPEFAKVKEQNKPTFARMKTKMGAFKVTISADDENSSDSESTGLVVQHALSADSDAHDQWIFDSGATCHMSNNNTLYATRSMLRLVTVEISKL